MCLRIREATDLLILPEQQTLSDQKPDAVCSFHMPIPEANVLFTEEQGLCRMCPTVIIFTASEENTTAGQIIPV